MQLFALNIYFTSHHIYHRHCPHTANPTQPTIILSKINPSKVTSSIVESLFYVLLARQCTTNELQFMINTPMNSTAATCSWDDDSDREALAARAAELLAAACMGQGHDVVQILEADPELLQVGDPAGDTALHVLVRAGHVEALQQLIRFLQGKHQELLKTVVVQGNGQGDTPLHLAIENRHRETASLLVKVEPVALYIDNEDGKRPWQLANETWGNYSFEDERGWSKQDQVLSNDRGNTLAKSETAVSSPQDKDEGKDKLARWYEQLLNTMRAYNLPRPRIRIALADLNMEIIRMVQSIAYEGKILDMLEHDPNLIQYKNEKGNTVLHEAAFSGNMDILTKLVGQLATTKTSSRDYQHPRLTLLLEGNEDGNTALHLAILKRQTAVANYLMEVAPEAAYQVNKEGISPLNLALKQGQDDLAKYMLQVMLEASISPSTRHTSLPHAAIRARNLPMLQMILETIPSLIDSSDEKGWKPLSYAAYKGYLEEVGYLLTKFPESVEKFDDDGSLPIHKAVSGGHISSVKEFISSNPQTLYAIDKKGRSVLHIAVRYAKADILSYLTHDINGIQKILGLRDHDGKTFVDLAKELKRN